MAYGERETTIHYSDEGPNEKEPSQGESEAILFVVL